MPAKKTPEEIAHQKVVTANFNRLAKSAMAKGATQGEIAQKMGIARPTLNAMMKGSVVVGELNARRAAIAFGVDLSEIDPTIAKEYLNLIELGLLQKQSSTD